MLESSKRAGSEAAKAILESGGNKDQAKDQAEVASGQASKPLLALRFHDLRHQAITDLREQARAGRYPDGSRTRGPGQAEQWTDRASDRLREANIRQEAMRGLHQ